MTIKRRISVWLVDDTEAVRKSLAAVLETADMDVRDFPTARSFLDSFDLDSVDCLIVDHHMPDMTGLQLLQHLQVREQLPPAILVTGHGSDELRARAIQAGAITMLDKPLDADEVVAMIQRLFPDAR